MHRLVDWEERVIRYLEEIRARPFEWGRHDCCTFMAGAAEAMTGVDPMPEFRGRYSTARGSVRALRKFGAGTLAATIDTKLQRVRSSHAHRGDVLMTGGALGLVWGDHAIVVGENVAREGIVPLHRRAWVDPIVWRVPYEAVTP